jgi:hypothetical protein
MEVLFDKIWYVQVQRLTLHWIFPAFDKRNKNYNNNIAMMWENLRHSDASHTFRNMAPTSVPK